mgnify:CR=1 FL=1
MFIAAVKLRFSMLRLWNMFDFIILFIVFLSIVVVVFSKAMECYFCGSREVTSRTQFRTRGLCDKCRLTGREIP